MAIEDSSKEVNNNKSRSNDKLDGINSHMINQLENHLEKWEKKIEEKLDEKLGEIDNKLKCMKVPTQKECKTFADAVTSNLQKVSEVEKKMTSLSKMPEELNKTIVDIMNNDQSKSIKGIIKVAICENRSDEKKSEGHKKNIILFNVRESPSESPEERKEEDITFCNKMCESICECSLPPESVTNGRRLGKRPDNNDSKRPLLIIVDSEITKRNIFGKFYKLRNNEEFKNINVSHDMSVEERMKTKLLLEEAKQKTMDLNTNDSSGSKNWIFRVRGPPWDQRIVKVRIISQN